MIDIKATREEMARIHAEATAFVEKYASEDATPEIQAEQDGRFSKLEKMQASIDAAEKLARFAFTKEEPVKAVAVTPQKSKDQIAVEVFHAAQSAAPKLDAESYARQLSAWACGANPEQYAAITSATAGGALVPSQVGQSLNLVNVNPYRAGLAAVGKPVVSYGSNAKVVNPVVSPFAGAALPEDGTTDTEANANAKIGTIIHNPKGYQSTTFWYSGLEIGAIGSYDITTSHLPALAGASDYAAAAAVTAAIKADSTITTANANVTTASTSTITQANLDAALNRVAMVYRAGRVLHLSPTAYALAEALADTTNKPLLTPDLQNQTLLRYRGVPVVMDPTLDAMGTSTNLVGMVISYTGFEWRDEQDKLLRFVGESNNPDKTGLNHVRYCDGAYYAPAIVKIVN